MKLFVFSIFDTASGVYLRPFFAEAEGQATRSFQDIAVSADHEIGKHPEDYTLFRVGIFDNKTGHFDAEPPTKVATAIELVSASRRVDPEAQAELNKKVASMSPGGTA